MRFLTGVLVLLVSIAPFVLPALVVHRLLTRRTYRQRMARIPLRSTKADAKRAAKKYAEEIAGKPLGWKAARKMLARLEREGRAIGALSR